MEGPPPAIKWPWPEVGSQQDMQGAGIHKRSCRHAAASIDMHATGVEHYWCVGVDGPATQINKFA